jgi:NADH dehydrogenase
MRRLALLPVLPISGSGRSAYQPIWAGDVARCVMADLERDPDGARYELAGPEVLTYDEIARTVARAAGRHRPLVHVPLGIVQLSLVALRRVFGDAVFATWEEAELMEVPMTTPRGTADAEALGVQPRPLAEVLAGRL